MNLQAEDRHIIILIMSFVFCISIPSLGFYHINHNRNDLMSVLLPLKRSHKFLSMVVTGGIVIPFLFMLATYFIDAFMQPQLLPSISPLTILKDTLTLFLTQSVFVLGNILFKRHKLGYSVICMLVLMGMMTFLGDLISGLDTSSKAIIIIHNLLFRYILPIVLYLLSLERFINLEL